ncbi:MAG: saccharopine dehydrogenase [Spirochaetes bacterium]|nr:MAG: saccharopine dehydrogenase [Spirochaetota bacterium]
MKILCVGGAGQIGREAVKDIVKYSNFKKISIGDFSIEAAEKLAYEINDDRVDVVGIDVSNPEVASKIMKNYDVVFGSLPIKYDELFVKAVIDAGVNGLDITGMGTTYFNYDEEARKKGIVFVPGVGMTPGTTNVLTRYVCEQMDEVDDICISHGAFRAIAYSPGLASTTFLEYDPDLPGRVVYENGKYVQVPPFSREKLIELPEPFGVHPQYIIPHPEGYTIPRFIKKNIKRIEVRGTWPPKNMRLVRALYEYGFLKNRKVKIKGVEIGSRDFIAAYLEQMPEGKENKLWGYSLHIDITGRRGNSKVHHVVTTKHPTEGDPEWEGPKAYTRSVGIPLSIGAQLIGAGKVNEKGVLAPEAAFKPIEFIRELKKRGIEIQEKVYIEHLVE